MLCPVCLHRARVIDTRHPRRRYHCDSCDIRWSTVETLTPRTLGPVRKVCRKPRRPAAPHWVERVKAHLAE